MKRYAMLVLGLVTLPAGLSALDAAAAPASSSPAAIEVSQNRSRSDDRTERPEARAPRQDGRRLMGTSLRRVDRTEAPLPVPLGRADDGGSRWTGNDNNS